MDRLFSRPFSAGRRCAGGARSDEQRGTENNYLTNLERVLYEHTTPFHCEPNHRFGTDQGARVRSFPNGLRGAGRRWPPQSLPSRRRPGRSPGFKCAKPRHGDPSASVSIPSRLQSATYPVVPNPGFINALNAMTGGRVVPLAGGVLIRNGDGLIVGAVGVSGAKPEEDAICARAGVDSCGL